MKGTAQQDQAKGIYKAPQPVAKYGYWPLN